MTTHPQAGDGIVELSTDAFWVVDGIENDSITKEFEAILYTNEMGQRISLKPHEYRRETFAEYLTRPTGFGRTSWTAFVFIQAMCIALIVTGSVTWSDGGWVAVAMALLVEGVLVWQSWLNYTGRNR
jgi:hypothetical protein